MNANHCKLVVVGSLNIDYIASVQRLPAAGETVAASGLVRRFGGKGANQALAAARQGAAVSLIGCVGADEAGCGYRRRLREEGINGAAISTTARALTGTALIAVDFAGENLIVVAAGANGALGASSVRAWHRLIEAARVVLLQLEVPMPAVIEAARLANRAGVPVVLNPSPLREGFPWSRCRVETLIVNEIEAQALFGLAPEEFAARPDAGRSALAERKVQRVIITRGARPTLCCGGDACFEVPALAVKPLDTVGAGDAFAGAFAARRAEGMDVLEAIRRANCAGALATLKAGAQESIPSRAATDRASRRLGPARRLEA
ncbi:MAG: ribokinase [Limisphaerales bacterium]